MIIRVFRALVKPGKGEELERMVREISIPLARGNFGCYMSRMQKLKLTSN